MTIYAIVYYAAPNVEVPRLRWITPGAIVGVLLWILASAGFFLYVSNFSSYSATYGAFAGAVVLLVWLWVTNLAMLFGAELNAVVDLRRSPVRRGAPTARCCRPRSRRRTERPALRVRAERGAAGAVAAQLAVGAVRDRVAVLEHACGELLKRVGEVGRLGGGRSWSRPARRGARAGGRRPRRAARRRAGAASA